MDISPVILLGGLAAILLIIILILIVVRIDMLATRIEDLETDLIKKEGEK